ncbi:MAG TPA: hypothetical protein VGL17_08105 [Gemmatimonadaceae bacterium]|jgi:hypothetical protein
MKQLLFGFVFLGFAMPAAAQAVDVGYSPPKSPFRDLEYHQELTLFGGYYSAAKDPAGAAPKSAQMEGIRYEITVGGPAQIYARLARVNSQRNVIDASAPAATRQLGVQSWPVYLFDAGLSLNLTGQRSFHGVVPVITAGGGLVSDLDKSIDADPFNLGTNFAFSFGAGLRMVPGGRFQIRADAGTYLYQIKYPTLYYVTASDGTAVLPSDQAKSFWKRNGALSLGVSYLLFR